MRDIRPALWVIFGIVAVLGGLLLALGAAAAATRLGDADSPRPCEVDFADGCSTERQAVLRDRGHVRQGWLSGEHKWLAEVPAGAPHLSGNELASFRIPRQAGREELRVGSVVTVVYFGQDDAWIRTPSGRTLETDAHPRRSAPMLAWFALFATAGGVFAVRTGIASGRAGRAWFRKTAPHLRPGPLSILTATAMIGALTYIVTNSAMLSALLGGGIFTGLSVLWWRKTHQPAGADA